MASTATFNCTATVEVSPVLRVVVTVGDGATTITDPWKLMRTNADGSQDEVRVPAYNPGSGTDEVFYDYEATQGTTVSYRVVFLNSATNSSFDGVGQRLSASVAVPDVGAYLIPPNNPSLGCPLMINQGGFAGWARPATVSSVQIIGSDTPFTVSQTRQAASGTVAILSINGAQHDALVAALKEPGPKLLSWPRQRWMAQAGWVFVSDVSDVPSPVYTSESWVTTLTLIPTSRPPVIPVLSIQPMGSMTVQAAMSVTVDEAMDRPLS